MRLVICSSLKSWNSGKRLVEKLREHYNKVLLVSNKNTKYKPKIYDHIVNFGNSKMKYLPNYNKPESISKSINKLKTLECLKEHGVPHVKFTTDYSEAKIWIDNGKTVVVRTILTGFGGAGIILANTHEQLTEALLYTEYKPKKHEYRVHVFNGEVISVSWKRKKKGAEINHKIRNFNNGWVYSRQKLEEVSDSLKKIAVDTTKALGLFFGAVDIIYNEKENMYYVLEVNTAPGLYGTTLESYSTSILKEYSND